MNVAQKALGNFRLKGQCMQQQNEEAPQHGDGMNLKGASRLFLGGPLTNNSLFDALSETACLMVRCK